MFKLSGMHGAVVISATLAACSSTSLPPVAPAPTTGPAARPAQGAVPVTEKSPEASAYEKQCDSELAKARARFRKLEQLEGDKTVATVLEPYNGLLMIIDRAVNQAGLYREVHPDAAVREAADRCEQQMQELITELGLSRPLFLAIKAIDTKAEDAVTTRYIEHLLRDFRRAGVDKDEATRAKVHALKDELVKIGQEFGKNIREDTRRIRVEPAALAGLPEDYIAAHAPGADGKVVISTDYPDYVPYMTYAQDDAHRLELYKVFRQRGYPKNIAVLEELLQKRYELARLLGYEDWAHYITEDKMIKTADAAGRFIDQIKDLSAARAQADYQELLATLRAEHPDAQKVGDWQKTYIEEQLKRTKYQLDSQAVRAYFPYERVKAGVLDVTSKLFGVSYVKVDLPVWHESVEAYEMRDKDGSLMGRFFLDMHPRENKYKHAAAFPMQTGVRAQQVPEAALVCNFPSGDALLEHDQVETFFHEFGHLIHHLFGGKQRWLGQSGFNTEWDFVEAPSQMLEEWAWDYESLATFAKNQAGEVIPAALVKKMRRARDFGKGVWVAQQMFYAAVSLAYYNRDPKDLDTTLVLRELQKKYSPFGYVDDTYFQTSFGHLDGYSAIYYTYMWSLVIAKDLLSVFRAQGMLNPAAAARYRTYVLEPGGSKDAAVLVHDFLSRDYTLDSFAKWLNASD